MGSNPSPNSIGVLYCPLYFIGGYDRDSSERKIIMNRIQKVYRDLSIYKPITFRIPVLHGIPLEIGQFCIQNQIDFITYNPFGRLHDFYSKTPEVVEYLVDMNKKATENFWPNGTNSRYGPNKVIKCHKAIINDSNMIILAGHEASYKFWLPHLKDKYHLFINVEKLSACNP